jgi:hypothetical protein
MDPANNPEVSAKSPPNKKLFIGAIAVVGIVIVFIFVSILASGLNKKESSAPTQQQPSSNYQTEKSNNSNSNSARSTAPATPKEWKVYQNSEFSVNYPPDWMVEELKFPNGDLGTSIHPSSKLSSNPSFLVTSSSSSSSASLQIQKLYMGLGFKQKFISIDNIQATELSGTFPPNNQITSATKNVIQASHIYLNRGGTDYLLKYTYTELHIDKSLEEIFGKVISSFKFI